MRHTECDRVMVVMVTLDQMTMCQVNIVPGSDGPTDNYHSIY